MSYNYKKVFFRRPILTQMNLFFWWFLLFALITIIPWIIFSVLFFSRIPEEIIQDEFKKYGFTRLFRIPRSEIVGGDEGEKEDTRSIPRDIFSEEEVPVDEDNNANIIKEPVIPPQMLAQKTTKSSPLQKYQKSREVYEENIKKFEVKDDKEIHIAKPSFTDFEVPQGYRSFEETITVGSESKKFIERCLERYFRIHPRFRGKIIVKFDVHPEGYVIDGTLKIEYSDIEYDPILDCIRKSIYRWVKYPAVAENRGIYSVTQKYIF